MFHEYIPPIANNNDIGKFKVDGTTLEVDENGMLKTFDIPYEAILDDNTWEQISDASTAGVAADLQAVGDCKKITLNGNIGAGLTLTNYDTYVFILGFDHNAELEGYGISFGGFKTAKTGGVDVALVDSQYSPDNSWISYTDGRKTYTMNHWGGQNYGGWKGCDLRYDILGSTDTAPSGYGSSPQTSRIGTDASSTTATNPVANTLMAALPSDLRVKMKPITKYTDNTGSSNSQKSVTASVDYLPLLAEYEVQGARTYANQYEQNSQARYQYYINGNSKVKCKQNNTSSGSNWWFRSAYYNSSGSFCNISPDGSVGFTSVAYSLAMAVAFLI